MSSCSGSQTTKLFSIVYLKMDTLEDAFFGAQDWTYALSFPSWFKKSSKKTCNLSQWQYFMEICQQNHANLLYNQHRRRKIRTSPTSHPILWANLRPSQFSDLPKRQSSGKQKNKHHTPMKFKSLPQKIISWKTTPSLLVPSAILKDKLAVKPLHHLFPFELYDSQLIIYHSVFSFLGIL